MDYEDCHAIVHKSVWRSEASGAGVLMERNQIGPNNHTKVATKFHALMADFFMSSHGELPLQDNREFTIQDVTQDGDPKRSVSERGQGHLPCNSTVLPNSTPLLRDF